MNDRMATRTKKCSICMNELQNPRILPCIHSFCLGCLEHYCYCRGKQPGDNVPCPECRKEFEIPKDGLAGLTVRTHSHEPELEASQNRDVGEYCGEHTERLRMYCFDCRINVCLMCCVEAHRTHKFESIDVVAKEFVRSIDDEIQELTSRVESLRRVAAQVEVENIKFLDKVQDTEQEIRSRGEEIKQYLARLIDCQVNDLLQELQSLKSAAEAEINSLTDTLHLALAQMESSKTSLAQLKSTGSPSDITQAACGLLVGAKELLQANVTPDEYHAPSYQFIPMNFGDFPVFVGHVVGGEDQDRGEENVAHDVSSDDRQAAQAASLQQQQQDDSNETPRESYFSNERRWASVRQPPKVTMGSARKRLSLPVDYNCSRLAGEKKVSHVASSRDVQTEQGTSSQQQQQQQHYQQSLSSAWALQQCSATALPVISTDPRVRGVTSVGDELFVLLERDVDQVAVYSINDYQPLRRLSVPGLKRGNDMTSCVRCKCLYMSDDCKKCIHKYDLSKYNVVRKKLLRSHISEWRVPGTPYGLSVTSSFNLLVTCNEPTKLVELSADSGKCVREITLQPDMVNPLHSVQLTSLTSQLTTGPLVVCHGFLDNDLHRVCLVGDDGKVTCSYGGQLGSNDGQLNMPHHVAVDKVSQSIFVADHDNNRVVLLSRKLELVRYVIEKLSSPHRLYLDQATRRLFVGQFDSDVVVIQL